jgi:hypothetical protein
MSTLPRPRRTRQTASSVRLAAPAAAWPAWTDNWYWEAGESPHDVADHVHLPEPFDPYDADIASYGRWLAGIDDGPLPPIAESCHTIEEWDAVRRGQISEVELGMLAAGLPLG